MPSRAQQSLLTHIDAPVVVGDPQGQAVYANPSFQQHFSVSLDDVTGRPLASLFDGGSRERVLMSVAEVCERGCATRFRVREKSLGYIATASPIHSGGEVVGVIILLTDSTDDERLLNLAREVQEPIKHLADCFENLRESTGGRRAMRYSETIEHGMHALEQLQDWTDDLREVADRALDRTSDRPARLEVDVVEIVHSVAEQTALTLKQAGINFELVVPSQLPTLAADAARLEEALLELLTERSRQVPKDAWITLAAKTIGKPDHMSLQIELTDISLSDSPRSQDLRNPPLLLEVAEQCGGTVRTSADPISGRTTSIRIPLRG